MRFPQIRGEFTREIAQWINDEAGENYDAFDWREMDKQFELERNFFPDMVSLMLDNPDERLEYPCELVDLCWRLYGHFAGAEALKKSKDHAKFLRWLKR